MDKGDVTRSIRVMNISVTVQHFKKTSSLTRHMGVLIDLY